jgi:Protein of unknown function (DUF2845)
MMNSVMRNILISVPVIVALIFIALDCSALRCGDEIVSTGDSKARVLIKCGKPTHKEKSGAKKSRRNKGGLEKWYYNCGKNDYIYALTFEKGILTNEETDGRGKGRSDCLGR